MACWRTERLITDRIARGFGTPLQLKMFGRLRKRLSENEASMTERTRIFTADDVKELANQAVAIERERCAKIADKNRPLSAVAGVIADEIRAGK